MTTQDIAAALQRVESVFQRRPESGVHDDAPGVARWQGGTRTVAVHANGTQVSTDMPKEFGGTGDQATPGWLLRSAMSACTATAIAMNAARRGIAIESLEVRSTSRSDARGLLGMDDGHGLPVYPGPADLQMIVSITAPGVPDAVLRTLVEDSNRCSPLTAAIRNASDLLLRIEVGGD